MQYFLNPDGETYTKDWYEKAVLGTLHMHGDLDDVYEYSLRDRKPIWVICDDPEKVALMRTTRMLMV